jgi:hypothetical protein
MGGILFKYLSNVFTEKFFSLAHGGVAFLLSSCKSCTERRAWHDSLFFRCALLWQANSTLFLVFFPIIDKWLAYVRAQYIRRLLSLSPCTSPHTVCVCVYILILLILNFSSSPSLMHLARSLAALIEILPRGSF